jgi:hypothetical protein
MRLNILAFCSVKYDILWSETIYRAEAEYQVGLWRACLIERGVVNVIRRKMGDN